MRKGGNHDRPREKTERCTERKRRKKLRNEAYSKKGVAILGRRGCWHFEVGQIAKRIRKKAKARHRKKEKKKKKRIRDKKREEKRK